MNSYSGKKVEALQELRSAEAEFLDIMKKLIATDNKAGVSSPTNILLALGSSKRLAEIDKQISTEVEKGRVF
jgi:hypothetical protein